MAARNRQLEKGRKAFERRSWRAAHDALLAARAEGGLGPSDLWLLALAAYLAGNDDLFVRALEEAHRAHLDRGDQLAAVRCAFWLGLHLAEHGEVARASGWFGRAGRILESREDDCAERGYMLLPAGHQALGTGDYEASYQAAAEAVRIGQHFGDGDLLTLALHLQGRALLRLGRVDEGLMLLDEAMLAVTTDELSPQVTGLVYCSVIGACREVWALQRAREWTRALNDWCERQPEMVAYRGECRVYRAEILQWSGRWHAALEEASRACDHLERGSASSATGFAFYLKGESHRLVGEFAAAEEAYRAASRAGREPQPGLALLRLAQGDPEAAAAASRRALAETNDPFGRTRLLPAHIEIMLAIGHVEEARAACAELEAVSDRCATGALHPLVAQARGACELAAGNPALALPLLRRASKAWDALGAPYHLARVRMLIGLACRELGDDEGSAMELVAARADFERLGAVPDLTRLDEHDRGPLARETHGLTPREREVLALVATGRTNRAIAGALFISERTVARHVANIFRKLGLSSRAAATAYAYEHGLLDSSH